MTIPQSSAKALSPTERTRLNRLPDRGSYDVDTINAILDAQPLAHLASVVNGAPHLVPVLQWRIDDRVYWHGAPASAKNRTALNQEISLCVSLLDGFVMARSAFHHSVNYRSVVLYGQAEPIVEPAAREAALRHLLEHLYPGRWDEVRPIADGEVRATAVLSLPIREGSAKLRTGQPKDDADDYALPIWAGIVPVQMVTGTPLPDPRNRPETPVSPAVRAFAGKPLLSR